MAIKGQWVIVAFPSPIAHANNRHFFIEGHCLFGNDFSMPAVGNGTAEAVTVLSLYGVLGFFRPKTTKNAEPPAPQSFQEGITFP